MRFTSSPTNFYIDKCYTKKQKLCCWKWNCVVHSTRSRFLLSNESYRMTAFTCCIECRLFHTPFFRIMDERRERETENILWIYQPCRHYHRFCSTLWLLQLLFVLFCFFLLLCFLCVNSLTHKLSETSDPANWKFFFNNRDIFVFISVIVAHLRFLRKCGGQKFDEKSI